MLLYLFFEPFSIPAIWMADLGIDCVGEPYDTFPESASCMRFCSLFSICKNLSDTRAPLSFSSDAACSHGGKCSCASLDKCEGRLISICPTPPMRSMFCLMFPKKGLAAFFSTGMGQPPMTGAISGPAKSSFIDMGPPARLGAPPAL